MIDKIIFIGFPNKIKTGTAEKLSEQLGYKFINAEESVKMYFGNELTGEKTEEVQTELEHYQTSFCKMVGNIKECVITTNGEAVKNEVAMKSLEDRGIMLIYLRMEDNLVKKELEENYQKINSNFLEYKALYEKYSMLTIDIQGKKIGDVLAIVMEKIS